MSESKYGRNSPFRPQVNRDDIRVCREDLTKVRKLGLENESQGKISERVVLRDFEPGQKRFSTERLSNNLRNLDDCSVENKKTPRDLDQIRMKEIEALTEELNYNRKRYEKLLADHAEEKNKWMAHLKQLQEQRDRII